LCCATAERGGSSPTSAEWTPRSAHLGTASLGSLYSPPSASGELCVSRAGSMIQPPIRSIKLNY
jgi:hypothetical protein